MSLTTEKLKLLIVKEEYDTLGVKTSVCVLTLVNGFEVIGTASCVDPDDFEEEAGDRLAYEDAFSQLWELEGYHQHYKQNSV